MAQLTTESVAAKQQTVTRAGGRADRRVRRQDSTGGHGAWDPATL